MPALASFDHRIPSPVRLATRHAELTPEQEKQLAKLYKQLAKLQNKLAKALDRMASTAANIAQTELDQAAVAADIPILQAAMEAAEQLWLDQLLEFTGKQSVVNAAKAALADAKLTLKLAHQLPAETEQAAAVKAAAIAVAEQNLSAAAVALAGAKQALALVKAELKAAKKALKIATKAWKKAGKLESKLAKRLVKLNARMAFWTDKSITTQNDIDDTEDDIGDLEDAGGDPPGGGEGDPPGGGEGDPPGGGEGDPPGGGEGDPPGGGEGDPPGGGEGDPPGGGEGDPPGDPPGGGGGDPPAQQGEVSLPILVQEVLATGQAGLDRSGATATFGLPFPQGQVLEHEGRPALAVDGSDRYQFTTLDTWPDGTVRWALADLQTDVLASQVNADLTVIEGDGLSGQNWVAWPLAEFIRLDTGPLQVDIPTVGPFNLFDRVVVNGTTFVESGTSPGILGVTDAGLYMGPASGTTVQVEMNGPARAVVRADGVLRDVSGQDILDFTCWITARYGSTELEVTMTVRNAALDRPVHTVIKGLGLVVKTNLDSDTPTATFNTHTSAEALQLDALGYGYLYQAYSGANTDGVTGSGPGYKPHIVKLSSSVLEEEGYRFVHDGTELHSLGNKSEYPDPGWMDLRTDSGGVTVAVKQMPFLWPVALEAYGDGTVVAGLWTGRKLGDYTFVWRQHESRTAVFSFHMASGAPAQVGLRTDRPVSGRAADYDHYDRSGVFPYDMLTVAEQEAAYAAMGITKTVWNNNTDVRVMRFLPAHQTGGANNYASIERWMAGEWLRHGTGGHWHRAMDLALYKSEWQILRSDDFHDGNDPGAQNDEIAHTSAHEGDTEHRYREGIILSYHLTGDVRFRDAILDEAEILTDVYMSPQERGMYQTLRAQALVAEFTGDTSVLNALRQRVQFNNSQIIDVSSGVDGWGWEAAPDVGARRYFANSQQVQSEKGPGENYIVRGFIAASFGPIAMHHASRMLGLSDTDGAMARGRLRDLAYWTKQELMPWNPNVMARHLVYSYGIQTQTVNSWQNSNGHPVVFGLAEAWRDTGDATYMHKLIENIEQFYYQDHGSSGSDLNGTESRLDMQHGLSVFLDYIDAGGSLP